MFFKKRKVKESMPTVTDEPISDFEDPFENEPDFAETSHKAIVEYMDGRRKEVPYYWAEGHDGKIQLTSKLKDGNDIVTEYDLKGDVKTLILA